jgi:hypothetical protein
VAERYRPLFEKMPPLAHARREEGESAVLRHIRQTLESIGETCDADNARRIFDGLRNRAYGIIVFRNECWQGVRYAPSGGAS